MFQYYQWLPFALKTTLFFVIGMGSVLYTVYFPSSLHRLLCCVGFSVQEIFVEGRKRTDLSGIKRALNLIPQKSLFSLDLPKILNTIERMPWVRSAVIERILPNRVYIRLCEKDPIAVWIGPEQKQYLIDKEGTIIVALNPKDTVKWNKLLKIMGANAPSNVLDLQRALSLLHIKTIHRAVFLRSGRWDVYVDHTLCVKLPEGEVTFGLQRFLALRHKIPKNVKVIDLRSGDSVLMEFDKNGPLPNKEQRDKKEKNEEV
ncbi:cell division protein FtsQ/DivIB [Holospora curviuscula]|uniref:cell division protein FtsQ/DivIB n=1 Tax=Holospora curviuscula TaxID=1082868 RepID=UPI000CE59632|nr:FtsQ-type POTRA domain-containing protein [Holospora curviuscula]